MIKFIVPACALTFASATILFGQDPTIKPADSVNQNSQTPYEQKNQIFDQGDRVKIKANEVPEALKNTLKSDEFKGWEAMDLYKSADGNTFFLDVNKEKKYRFDAKGKRIKTN